MEINTHTKLCFVIGDPVEHSLSPEFHNRAYKKMGLEGQFIFLAAHVKPEDLKEVMTSFRQIGVRGISCTLPHKETVLPFLDKIDPVAKEIGAVNTIINENGKFTGYNTDWIGIVEPLKKHGPIKGKKVAIMGAGGVAKAAVYGLLQQGAQVTVFNRSAERAIPLSKQFSIPWKDLSQLSELSEMDIIIQASSVGMKEDESLIPKDLLQKGQIAFELIYTPRWTRFLKEAEQKGLTLIFGEELFLEQAKAQFEMYTGQASIQLDDLLEKNYF